MKNLDIEWLKKIQNHVDSLNRGCGKFALQCEKEIFVNRYFKFLENRCFKIKYKETIIYAFFVKQTIKYNCSDLISNNYGVQFRLTWGNADYNLIFINEKGKRTELKLHYNDFFDLKYQEITLQEYSNILKLFT